MSLLSIQIRRGQDTIRALRRLAGMDKHEPTHTILVDALADMLHATSGTLDIEDACRLARVHYETERNDAARAIEPREVRSNHVAGDVKMVPPEKPYRHGPAGHDYTLERGGLPD